MSINLVGVFVNVQHKANGEHVKEEVIKQLKDGTCITTEKTRFNAADHYRRGKGYYVDMVGGAATKPEKNDRATPPAITFALLEGKKINGQEVTAFKKRDNKVILADGSVLDLSDIRRQGKGFVCDAAVIPAESKKRKPKVELHDAEPAKTQTKGGAKAKVKKDSQSGGELYGPAGQYTRNDIRGQVIDVDGEETVVKTVYTNDRFLTEDGQKFHTDEVRKRHDGVFCVYSSAYIEEMAALRAAASAPKPPKKNKVPKAPVGEVTTKEIKDQEITIGDEIHVVESIYPSGNVKTDEGFKFHISQVERSGSDYIYVGPLKDSQKGGALPESKAAPAPASSVLDVPAYDRDTVSDIRTLIADAVAKALAETYNVDIAGVFVAYREENMTVSISLGATGADKAQLEAIAQRQKALLHTDSEPRNFDKKELTKPAHPEDEEEEEEVEEDEEVEEEVEEEEDSEFADISQVFDQEGDDVPFDQEGDVSFPVDVTELVEAATARLARSFPKLNLTAYVRKWYESQDVFDAIEYNVEPGNTITTDTSDYVLIGLDNSGTPLMVNALSNKSRKGVSLTDINNWVTQA